MCILIIYGALSQVRLVVHALERMWKIRDISEAAPSGRRGHNLSTASAGTSSTHNYLTYSRPFCWLRHSLHFFVSHLFYYLQIDVIDAEYSEFNDVMASPNCDFATVVRHHRLFLSNVARHGMVDNVVVQDGIDSILHVCLRFLALCRILLQDDSIEEGLVPVVIPPEEFDSLQVEFVSLVLHLMHHMRRVDNVNQGFLLRLDFNGFLSNLILMQNQKMNGGQAGRGGRSPSSVRSNSNSPSKRATPV
jgi:hypothetical protein